MKKITVCDISLHKLTEERNARLLFRDKTAIAKGLDANGADIIQLAPIKSVREDGIIYKTVASIVENAQLSVPVGYTVESINLAYQCVEQAKNPRLSVSLPTSTVTMEYTLHIKEEKMLSKIQELVKASAALCKNVEFEAKDATRANPEFLIKAVQTAVESGATSVCLCDDEGTALPSTIELLVKSVKSAVAVPLFLEVNDTLHLACANALAGITAGAEGIKTAISGKNVLNTADFCDLIALKGESLGFYSGLKTTAIHRDIATLLKKVRSDKTALTTDIATSDCDVYLNADCKIADVTVSARALGYDLSEDDITIVHKEVLRVCEKKTGVGTKEFEAIIASYAMQAPSTYQLKSFIVTSGNVTNSMAKITLLKNEQEELMGVACGDGPIDAAFKAIEQCVGCHYELDNFEIQAVTRGKEALGSTVVRLLNAGKLYSGSGLSTDIIGSGVIAYIQALNKIAAEEELI